MAVLFTMLGSPGCRFEAGRASSLCSPGSARRRTAALSSLYRVVMIRVPAQQGEGDMFQTHTDGQTAYGVSYPGPRAPSGSPTDKPNCCIPICSSEVLLINQTLQQPTNLLVLTSCHDGSRLCSHFGRRKKGFLCGLGHALPPSSLQNEPAAALELKPPHGPDPKSPHLGDISAVWCVPGRTASRVSKPPFLFPSPFATGRDCLP